MSRTNGQRWTDAVDPGTLPPPGPAELRLRIDDLAAQVRRLGEPAAGAAAGATTGPLADDVIAMAERAAEEIRAHARREAARLGQRAAADAPELARALLASVSRERQTVAVLAAEVERLSQSAEQLRAHIRLLEDELGRIDAFLRATTAPAA